VARRAGRSRSHPRTAPTATAAGRAVRSTTTVPQRFCTPAETAVISSPVSRRLTTPTSGRGRSTRGTQSSSRRRTSTCSKRSTGAPSSATTTSGARTGAGTTSSVPGSSTAAAPPPAVHRRDAHRVDLRGPLARRWAGRRRGVGVPPELLDLGDRRLLHVSDYENVVYFLGPSRTASSWSTPKGCSTTATSTPPQSLSDSNRGAEDETDTERSLTWGWLPEARDVDAQWDAGWSGALSLPPGSRPPPTATSASVRPTRRPTSGPSGSPTTKTVALAPDDQRRLDVSGAAIEIEIEIALDDAEAVEISVFETPDRAEHTPIRYARDGTLSIDRTPSSRDPRAFADARIDGGSSLRRAPSLRVFLDRSVIGSTPTVATVSRAGCTRPATTRSASPRGPRAGARRSRRCRRGNSRR